MTHEFLRAMSVASQALEILADRPGRPAGRRALTPLDVALGTVYGCNASKEALFDAAVRFVAG